MGKLSRENMDKARQELVKSLERSGKFSERERAILRNTGCTLFGYERRTLMSLTDDELADVMIVIAKMLKVGAPFASVARWAAADLYERVMHR